MSNLDWILVAFVVVTALGGSRRGVIRMALAFVGLAIGAIVGARAAPHFLAGGDHSHYTALVGLGGGLAGAMLGQVAASLVGRFIRGGLHLLPPLRLLDSFGGLVVGAVWGLALVWVAGAVALQIDGHPKVRRDVRHSHVLRRLDAIASPKDLLRVRLSLERPYISVS